MNKLIFLDIDGVLNTHNPHPNGYTGVSLKQIKNLETLLEDFPDAKIVLSSAWRYVIANGDMTLRGFEYLLATSGAWHHKISGKFIGITPTDDDMMEILGIKEPGAQVDLDFVIHHGEDLRAAQIEYFLDQYTSENGATAFVVIDDLNIPITNLVRTDPNWGLTEDDAIEAWSVLYKQENV